jgi:soluble lytic murein transglycosylase-like protein
VAHYHTLCNLRLILLVALPLVLGFGLTDSVLADIYRYQDEQGVVFFTNVPADPKYRLFYKESPSTPPAAPLKGARKFPAPRNNEADDSMVTLSGHIETASLHYGLDPKLVQAVIQVESRYNPLAVSPKGAQGLMQLMPQTARDLQVNDPFSPKENIDGGARYLRYLMDIYNQDMTLALAAYNAGPERVNLYRGIPPYLETKSYVQKVMQTYNRLKSQLLSTR